MTDFIVCDFFVNRAGQRHIYHPLDGAVLAFTCVTNEIEVLFVVKVDYC